MIATLPSLIWLSLGLLLALMLRKPLRRAFGAGPALLIWLLPLLLPFVAWLPAELWPQAVHDIAIPLPALVVTTGLQGTDAASHAWAGWMWAIVAFLLTLRLTWQNRTLRTGWQLPTLSLLRDLRDLGMTRRQRRGVRMHTAGPAVLWLGHTRLLLPSDFLQRFDAEQRRLVLRHEQTHLRRGDPFWRLLAETTRIVLWFHPLVWLALPRFRLDQELACDEAVLRRAPASRVRYAKALFHGATCTPMPTVLTSWLDEPQLKERLTMIHTHHHGTLRRRFGYLALTALLGGGAWVAQAATPQSKQQAEAPQHAASPQYPASAIKNGEEGRVLMHVLVAADGYPKEIKVHQSSGSPDLDRSAIEAVRGWQFSPAMQEGQAVESWVSVPIEFSLDEHRNLQSLAD